MLELIDFSFSFKDAPVLAGLGFSLKAGEYLSIIGPNGAGKSTLLKCILRLHETGRTTGTIKIKGRNLTEYGQKNLARIVSYVPQAGGWIPPFTIRELLRLSRYPYADSASGLKADDFRAIDRALSLTGLTAMAGRYLKTLSGGERQKAYLAAALAQETEVMLLDEPASFLDPSHVAELNALLTTLNQEQKLTMITVTHDLNQAVSRDGPVLVLRQGQQVYFGPAGGLAGQVLSGAYQHDFLYLTHPRTGRPVILAE